MERDIVCDPALLAVPSQPASEEDIAAAEDLLDTLKAHSTECVGMAANMIGVNKNIIVVETENGYLTMFNPEIVKKEKPYTAEEGCLSLRGYPRKAQRYEKIKVRWQNERFETRIKNFSGRTAQIIQHETDHCLGILI